MRVRESRRAGGEPAGRYTRDFSLRAARPRQRPALPRVEEFRPRSGPGCQRGRLGILPDPRGHRILPVLRPHPPVNANRKPAHSGFLARRPTGVPPGSQYIGARTRSDAVTVPDASCHSGTGPPRSRTSTTTCIADQSREAGKCIPRSHPRGPLRSITDSYEFFSAHAPCRLFSYSPRHRGPRLVATDTAEYGAAISERLSPTRISASYAPSSASTIDSTASKGARCAPSRWCRSARNPGEL